MSTCAHHPLIVVCGDGRAERSPSVVGLLCSLLFGGTSVNGLDGLKLPAENRGKFRYVFPRRPRKLSLQSALRFVAKKFYVKGPTWPKPVPSFDEFVWRLPEALTVEQAVSHVFGIESDAISMGNGIDRIVLPPGGVGARNQDVDRWMKLVKNEAEVRQGDMEMALKFSMRHGPHELKHVEAYMKDEGDRSCPFQIQREASTPSLVQAVMEVSGKSLEKIEVEFERVFCVESVSVLNQIRSKSSMQEFCKCELDRVGGGVFSRWWERAVIDSLAAERHRLLTHLGGILGNPGEVLDNRKMLELAKLLSLHGRDMVKKILRYHFGMDEIVLLDKPDKTDDINTQRPFHACELTRSSTSPPLSSSPSPSPLSRYDDSTILNRENFIEKLTKLKFEIDKNMDQKFLNKILYDPNSKGDGDKMSRMMEWFDETRFLGHFDESTRLLASQFAKFYISVRMDLGITDWILHRLKYIVENNVWFPGLLRSLDSLGHSEDSITNFMIETLGKSLHINFVIHKPNSELDIHNFNSVWPFCHLYREEEVDKKTRGDMRGRETRGRETRGRETRGMETRVYLWSPINVNTDSTLMAKFISHPKKKLFTKLFMTESELAQYNLSINEMRSSKLDDIQA